MDDFRKDIKVGDYVFFKQPKDYKVAMVTKLGKDTFGNNDFVVWGRWLVVEQLPITFEDFNNITKCTNDEKFVGVNAIDGVLVLVKKTALVMRDCDVPEKLLKLDSYKSSTIIALNKMLGDGYDFEDVLRVLIPNITEINEN